MTLIKNYGPQVDQKLRDIIEREEQIENLHEGLLYSLGLDPDSKDGGKRLRPIMCLAATDALGGNIHNSLGFACAIELMHNFALVHDDIEDGDVTRRDRPSTYIKYGIGHGINIGDYLFCKVWSTLLEEGDLSPQTRIDLMKLMSNTLDHTHVGQALDMNAREKVPFSLEDYFRLVREKTGYYLSAPMVGAAIVSDADHQVIDAVEQYGHFIGPLFQITDDTLDFTIGKGRGGVIGSDIREGKRSFLVAYVSEHGTEAQISELFDILNADRKKTTEEMVKAAINIFEASGAVKAANEQSVDLLNHGLRCLKNLPAPLEALLAEFAQSLVDRKK